MLWMAGRVSRSSVWPGLCDYFRLQGGVPKTGPRLSKEFVKENASVWSETMQRWGLPWEPD